MKNDQLDIDQQRLLDAWRRTLPSVISSSDKCEVNADEADPRAVRVTIHTAGHSMYSFDFKCTYVDSREIKVDLIDAEREDQTVDERTEIIQTLVKDYIRHIHECAQQLHALTSGS
jgi:hypothetical protein